MPTRPMVTAAKRAQLHVTDDLQVVLADAGYWHTEEIERLDARGVTHNLLKLHSHQLKAMTT